MHAQVEKITTHIIGIGLILLAFLTPLFFFPLTTNFYDTNKLMLVVVLTPIISIIWFIKLINSKTIRITFTPFTLPLVLIALVYLSASFIQSNKVEAFMGRGLLFPILTLLFITFTSVLQDRKVIRYTLYTLISSGMILSLVSIFQSLGGTVANVLNRILHTSLAQTLEFSPTGSSLYTIIFLVTIFLVTITWGFAQKKIWEKIFFFLLSIFIVWALILNIVFVKELKNQPLTLPYRIGYEIALETFKQPLKTALLGFGPESYMNAYTQTRPAWINLDDKLWNLRFTIGSNEPLTTAATTGILGITTWIILFVVILKLMVSKNETVLGKILKISVGTLILFQFLLPGNIVALTTLYIFLALWAIELRFSHPEKIRDIDLGFHEVKTTADNSTKNTTFISPSAIITYLLTLPGILVLISLLYFSFRLYSAEVKFKDSLAAANKNDGTATYNLQREAIALNPYISNYHRAFATTNLAIASTLTRQAQVSDQDRQTATQLIQQSIAEAKNAATIDSHLVLNWETLAGIYRNLINVADGAINWTVASYLQAIQTDPVNPRLRLELGGIYFNLKQYELAIRLFQQASELKPNWANAFYNLAAAYKDKGELKNSLDNLELTLRLLEPKSNDYQTVTKEIADLRKALKLDENQQTATGSSQITRPSPLPSPIAKPIQLPEGTGPNIATPSTELTPGPTPTPTSTPTPTP